MSNQEIYELIDRFEKSSLTAMKLSVQDFKLELSRDTAAKGESKAGGQLQADMAMQTLQGKKAALSGGPTEAQNPAAGGTTAGPFITAPMVGTYYAASAPGQSPFVMPGDRVFKGQTVCMMEAMKMISEIPAPCDCVIEEILKVDGDLAAFGEPLFRYQPC